MVGRLSISSLESSIVPGDHGEPGEAGDLGESGLSKGLWYDFQKTHYKSAAGFQFALLKSKEPRISPV